MSIRDQVRLTECEEKLARIETSHAAKIHHLESKIENLVRNLASAAVRAAAERPPIPVPRQPKVLVDLLRTQ